MDNGKCKEWYEESYRTQGFKAQRRYPNEELCRFMGRHFFDQDFTNRKEVKILEVGCGSCSNLWMISKEGFDTYGLDLSEHALELGKEMIRLYGGGGEMAALVNGDMMDLPFEDNTFDVILDVFSSHCLPKHNYQVFTKEVYRVLKKGGMYFAYTPSKNSDEFKHSEEKEKIDSDTLACAKEGYAYEGNDYPFRFMDKGDVCTTFREPYWKVEYLECLGRTYQRGSEYFEFLVLEVKRL